jgi:hypothetical protein
LGPLEGAGVGLGDAAGVVGIGVGDDAGVLLTGGAGTTTGVFVGAVLVGGAEAVTLTRIAKAGRLADAFPSDTAMATPTKSPMSDCTGEPVSRPVSGSKEAHAGLFVIENTSRSELASVAVGLNA